jgi:hypothetical protein
VDQLRTETPDEKKRHCAINTVPLHFDLDSIGFDAGHWYAVQVIITDAERPR